MPGPTARYQAFLDAGEFRLQRSRTTGAYIFEPRLFEPGTAEPDLEWSRPSGKGVVYAVTTVRPRSSAPYCVVLIDLEEGVRLMSTVTSMPAEDVVIGLPVVARVEVVDGLGRLVFDPAR